MMNSSSTDSERLDPYPGLRPFQNDEDYLFFGRENQVGELMDLLRSHQFLAVVGTSGSGKSSLVRCGLLSELQGGMMVAAGSRWEIAVMQPGGDPLANLAQALIDAELYDGDDSENFHRILATINRSTHGLVEAVNQSEIGAGSNLLLVVDQFEEIFRFHQASDRGEEQAPDFIRRLLHAVHQVEMPIYVVLTMRSDFLGDCARFTGLAETINNGEYLVPKLNRDQLRQAIEGPARVADGQVSRRLVQRLLNDVGEQSDQLPVLQHALMRSWEHCIERTGGAELVMDLQDYESIGTMADALSNHADEVLNDVVKCEGEESRGITSRLFKALTEQGDDNRGIRRPTRLGDLAAITAAPIATLKSIINAYRAPGRTFLMPSADMPVEAETVIDISHESLMRVWKRLNRWAADEAQSVRIYSRLSDTASLWSQDKAGLYRDPDLQIATGWMETEQPNEAWAKRFDGDFERSISFLDQSEQAQHEAERAEEAARQRELEQARQLAETEQLRAQDQARSIKRFRLLTGVIGVVALIAVGSAVVAYNAMQNAEQNEIRATKALAAREASQKQLRLRQRKDDLADAEASFEQGDVVESVKTLQAASQREPSESMFVRQAMQYISQHSFFTETMSLAPSSKPGATSRVFPLPPLRGFAIAGETGTLSLRLKDDSPATTLSFESPVIRCAATAECVQILTAKGTIHCWRPAENQRISLHERFQNVQGFPPAFAPDSVTFLPDCIVAYSKQTLWIVALGGDQPDQPISIANQVTLADSLTIRKAIVTADRQRACILDENNNYRLFDLKQKPTETRALSSQSEVVFMAELPLQQTVLSVEQNGLIQLLDSADPKLDMILDADDVTSTKQFLISPDSTRLAMLSHGGDVRVINLADGESFFLQQEDSSFQFEVIGFDPAGVVISGVDRDGRLTAIDSETGQQLVSPSIVTIAPASFFIPHTVDPNGRPLAGLHVGGITIPPAGKPRVAQWRLVLAEPNAPEFRPDLNAIDLSKLQKDGHSQFFAYWINRISGGSHAQPSPGPVPEFGTFVFERELHAGSQIFDPAAIASYWSNRAVAGKSLSLSRAFLASQVTPEVLAGAMTLASEQASSGNISARYHHIRFLMKYFLLPDSHDFSAALLKRLARYENLLEARSMAYRDQSHVGPTLRLDSAEHVESWDGLKNRFIIKKGSIKTPDLRGTWPDSPNQYVIWRGAEFADFRVRFLYRVSRNNSGITIRGTTADDPAATFGANRLHEYLQKGYQPDFLAPQAGGFNRFAGVLISDNFNGQRPLQLALRGEHVVWRRNDQRLARRLTPDTPTHDELRSVLDHGPEFATMTVEARRHRIDMTDGDVHLNTCFDFHMLRRLSGNISFQSSNIRTLLEVNTIEVNRLGRDLAEAELSRPGLDSTRLDRRIICEVLSAQMKWDELATELQRTVATNVEGEWARKMLRDVNIRRRHTQRRLTRACMSNDSKAVKEIIAEVADAELLNKLAHENVGDVGKGTFVGTSALAAAIHGSLDVLKLLTDNGVSIDQRAGGFGFVVAHGAALANQPEIMKYLLAQGSDANSTNRFGFSLLQEASRWGGPECVKMLLDAGANIEHGSNNGNTPIQIVAGTFGSVDAYSPSEGGEMWNKFARSDRRIEVARLLIEAGSKPDAKYGGNLSAIERATRVGDTKLAEFLQSQVKP